MKLAAIDIGTNSIHMIVVQVLPGRQFEVIDRVKEMVKLGAGVFATHRISDRAFKDGLKAIQRYVQIAEQRGVDDIITAATSAIREAQNGELFLREVERRTQIRPRMIAGKEEARLIFRAVQNAIDLGDRTALVFDIGGGSTEVAVGTSTTVHMQASMRLGVQRLLDMFSGKGPVTDDARGVLEAHIHFVAQQLLSNALQQGFTQVIGTSGTIRNLGKAVYCENHKRSLQSVNAEEIRLSDLQGLAEHLARIKAKKRAHIDGISEKRSDTIHLGGILLVKLLQMSNVQSLTLCDASLREGMILDYLDRHSHGLSRLPLEDNLKRRKAAQLVYKYDSNWESNIHIEAIAQQLFNQTQPLHSYGQEECSILSYAALLHDIGQYLSFRSYHKNSRYILERVGLRGATDEEILLIGHVIRYHRKAEPKKKHKKFKRLSKARQKIVWTLAGFLRIAVALDRTKNQQVSHVSCQISDQSLDITLLGTDLEIERWAAQDEDHILAKVLDRTVTINVLNK